MELSYINLQDRYCKTGNFCVCLIFVFGHFQKIYFSAATRYSSRRKHRMFATYKTVKKLGSDISPVSEWVQFQFDNRG